MLSIFEQFQDHLNAPEFIYSILNNTSNPPRLRGRGASHPEKNVNGVPVDKATPSRAIKYLTKLNSIEPRASCQGSGEERPTFFIFRPKNQDINYIKKKVKELNSKSDIVAGYGIGGQGYYRIGVTTDLWYDKNPQEFKKWWIRLADVITDIFD